MRDDTGGQSFGKGVATGRVRPSSIIPTTNRGITSWGEIFEGTTVAAAILDRRLRHATVAFCRAKFMDPDFSEDHRRHIEEHPDVLTGGYATTTGHKHGADEHWIGVDPGGEFSRSHMRNSDDP